MAFTCHSDGTGEAAVTKVDVSALSPAPDEVVIERIVASTSANMGVEILWDADTDVTAWIISPNTSYEFCFCGDSSAGLTNTSGAGKTGDIKFTTGAGFGTLATTDAYSIVLYLRKKHTS